MEPVHEIPEPVEQLTAPPRERIWHVSETAGIARFEPRADAEGRNRVWAIGESRLHNYLLPRDCPRVTFHATATTSPADRARFFSVSATESVVAIERGWLERVRATRLYLYEFARDGFELTDAIAAYWTSERSATPIGCTVVDDPLAELGTRAVELRALSSLWPLRDAVVASTLGFSIIRMRNAQPRDALLDPR
jgi:hypothetical protein